MAHYFASDVHLRFDQPDRDRRFCNWLGELRRDDELVIGGDLCDFWMAARHSEEALLESASLRALAEFRRGGRTLKIMAGNHDAWLCPFYERRLGAEIIADPYDTTIHGVRIRLVHGHLLGARRRWKSWMESHAFFAAFGCVPGPVAAVLDQVLARHNQRELPADEERHLRRYREYAAECRGNADILIVGHVHRPVDESECIPRLVVLGGWQYRTSYLKVDVSGATFHIEDDQAGAAGSAGPSSAAIHHGRTRSDEG